MNPKIVRKNVLPKWSVLLMLFALAATLPVVAKAGGPPNRRPLLTHQQRVTLLRHRTHRRRIRVAVQGRTSGRRWQRAQNRGPGGAQGNRAGSGSASRGPGGRASESPRPGWKQLE